MKKILATYRPKRITSPYNLEGNISLNGVYTASFFLNNMFGDWHLAGLTDIQDQIIPENRYTSEIVPGVKKLTRFLVCEYNEEYVDPAELGRSMENVGREFDICVMTTEEALTWIRSNTDLKEVEPGKFLISEEKELMGEIIPALYLYIN